MDGQYQEIVPHLLESHQVPEILAVSMFRNLAVNHPVHKVAILLLLLYSIYIYLSILYSILLYSIIKNPKLTILYSLSFPSNLFSCWDRILKLLLK